MRSLLLVITGVAVILGVASTNLWLDLRNERAHFADMRAQLSEARAASRVLASRPSTVVPAPAPVAVPVAAAAAATPACKPTTPLPTTAVPAVDLNIVRQQNSISERDLLKDPEYRKARLATRRLELQRSNPGVVEALGLSEKDADRFFDLLAENQIRMSELPAVNASGTSPQAAAQESNRNRQAQQKQQDESIAALLGDTGYGKWQEYQQTRGARSQAISMGSQLLQMGLPLSNAQLKPLTAALVVEQQRQTQESQLFPRQVITDPQARAAQQEEAQRRTAESNRRLLAAIAPSLSPQQLAVFREQYESQDAMNRVSTRARERAMAARGQ